MEYTENYQTIEIIIDKTTSIDTYKNNDAIIIKQAYSYNNFNKEKIILSRPLLLHLYIESTEIYPLEFLKTINNKLFSISFEHFRIENNSKSFCKKNSKQNVFCGYDSFDIHTAKPMKGLCCEYCYNQTCQSITHCIRMDDLWYNVYAIDLSQLHFSVSLHMYELEDDFTWTSILKTDLHGFPSINKTIDIAHIQITSLRIFEPSISHIFLNEHKYLLVRQPVLTINKKIKINDNDQLNEFNDEFMVINKSELNLDEDDICKMVHSTTDYPLCSIKCSKTQPFDFWLFDKSNEINKRSLRYIFRPYLEFPIHEHDNKFKLLVPFKYHFRLNITLKQRQSIGFKCLISISEISIESFSKYTFQIALIINNTGLSICSIRIYLEQNQQRNFYFIKKEHQNEYHINPMYEELIFFTISIKRRIFSTININIRIKDLLTKLIISERKFLLKYAHHCICISVCHCQCFKNTFFPNLLQLKCIPMHENDINQAGLSHINDNRILKLLSYHENPLIKITNEQSRYIRKWFLFIAIFALCLSKLK